MLYAFNFHTLFLLIFAPFFLKFFNFLQNFHLRYPCKNCKFCFKKCLFKKKLWNSLKKWLFFVPFLYEFPKNVYKKDIPGVYFISIINGKSLSEKCNHLRHSIINQRIATESVYIIRNESEFQSNPSKQKTSENCQTF